MSENTEGISVKKIEGWLKLALGIAAVCGSIFMAGWHLSNQWDAIIQNQEKVNHDLPALQQNMQTLTSTVGMMQTEQQRENRRIDWLARQSGYHDGQTAKQ